MASPAKISSSLNVGDTVIGTAKDIRRMEGAIISIKIVDTEKRKRKKYYVKFNDGTEGLFDSNSLSKTTYKDIDKPIPSNPILVKHSTIPSSSSSSSSSSVTNDESKGCHEVSPIKVHVCAIDSPQYITDNSMPKNRHDTTHSEKNNGSNGNNNAPPSTSSTSQSSSPLQSTTTSVGYLSRLLQSSRYIYHFCMNIILNITDYVSNNRMYTSNKSKKKETNKNNDSQQQPLATSTATTTTTTTTNTNHSTPNKPVKPSRTHKINKNDTSNTTEIQDTTNDISVIAPPPLTTQLITPTRIHNNITLHNTTSTPITPSKHIVVDPFRVPIRKQPVYIHIRGTSIDRKEYLSVIGKLVRKEDISIYRDTLQDRSDAYYMRLRSQPRINYKSSTNDTSNPVDQVDHIFECQMLAHSIYQCSSSHTTLKALDFTVRSFSTLSHQPYIIQNILNPLKTLHNCIDDETYFNLKLLNSSMNSTKGHAVSTWLDHYFNINPPNSHTNSNMYTITPYGNTTKLYYESIDFLESYKRSAAYKDHHIIQDIEEIESFCSILMKTIIDTETEYIQRLESCRQSSTTQQQSYKELVDIISEMRDIHEYHL